MEVVPTHPGLVAVTAAGASKTRRAHGQALNYEIADKSKSEFPKTPDIQGLPDPL